MLRPEAKLLSILYLRCRRKEKRGVKPSSKPADLSILYLRCGSGTPAHCDGGVGAFQFSI